MEQLKLTLVMNANQRGDFRYVLTSHTRARNKYVGISFYGNFLYFMNILRPYDQWRAIKIMVGSCTIIQDLDQWLVLAVSIGYDHRLLFAYSSFKHITDGRWMEKSGLSDFKNEIRICALTHINARQIFGTSTVHTDLHPKPVKGGPQTETKTLSQIFVGLQPFQEVGRKLHVQTQLRIQVHIWIQLLTIFNAGQGAPDTVQIAVTITAVRLQVGTFRPLIPCVNQNELAVRGQGLAGHINKMLKPLLEATRGTAMHYIGFRAITCSVVPHRNDVSEIGEILGLLPAVIICHIIIVQHCSIDRSVSMQTMFDLGGISTRPVMQHPLGPRIHPKFTGVGGPPSKNSYHIRPLQTCVLALTSPYIQICLNIRNRRCAIHEQNWPTIHMDITIVPEKRYQVLNETLRIVGRVILSKQNLAFVTVPAASPVLVSPTETEGHLD